jgi:RNA polymerase sigma factor (sigma-70 family)
MFNTSPEYSRLEQFRHAVEALSERERQVFDRIIEGKTAKEIGEELGIGKRTVDVHRTHILMKLGVTANSVLMTRLATKAGF